MGLNKPVDFSTAKLLKEKGFDKECEKGWYLPHSTIAIKNKIEPNTWQLVPIHPLLNQIRAPTISEVVTWLYEKHKIWISISMENNEEDKISFYYSITENADGETYFRIRKSNFNSPTEAYKDATEYCLKKII